MTSPDTACADNDAAAGYVLMSPLIILIACAAILLYRAWSSKTWPNTLRYLLIVVAASFTVITVAVSRSITPADIMSALRTLREIEPLLGWIVTTIFAVHALMPIVAIVAAIKVVLEPEPESGSSIGDFVCQAPSH